MLADTHSHLDFKDFDPDRDEVIKRAGEKGVGCIINVGTGVESSRASLELAGKYENVFASIGIHPNDADSVGDDAISKMRDMAGEKKVVAIGETGLDYYKNRSQKDAQKHLFREFIRLSTEFSLPLIIHNRRADEEALGILREEIDGDIKGVMHCFSGDKDFLGRCVDAGLYISFTCNITFKNAGRLRDVASAVPAEKLLLETDAPFLAPQAMRGKRNEPSYITYLAEELARIKGVTVEEIEKATMRNAVRLFGLNAG